MSTAARPEDVRLWCRTCHRFVEVTGRVFASTSGTFAPGASVHVTPADWAPHRATHRRRGRAAG